MNGDEAEIIGGQEPPVYTRRVRNAANPATFRYLCACFCCICFFFVIILVTGFLLTNGFTNNPTPSPTPAPTPTPIGALQCGGFLDLDDSAQPQSGTTCFDSALGNCFAASTCRCVVVDEGSTTQLATTTLFDVVVAPETCPEADPLRQCQCAAEGVPITCVRSFGTSGSNNFPCSEEKGCPFFTGIPLANQPISTFPDCGLGTTVVGVCAAAGSNACSVAAYNTTVSSPSTPAPLIQCAASAVCSQISDPCACFISTCSRLVDGVDFQFFCKPISQIPTPISVARAKAANRRKY